MKNKNFNSIQVLLILVNKASIVLELLTFLARLQCQDLVATVEIETMDNGI